jgi:hypothetical protein
MLVRDVLHDGPENFPAFVVEHVSVPVRIDDPQFVDDPVVLPEP